MRGVAIITSKGGVGKTTLCHLLAVGAVWRNVPAYLFHTDNREPMTTEQRPYAYIDGRDANTLETVISSLLNSDGVIIVDGGGNRPEIDMWLAEHMDLVLIPVMADTESVNLGIETMQRLEGQGINNARYILNMVSTNEKARLYDFEHFFSRLDKEKIAGQVKRMDAVKRLSMPDAPDRPFQTPPSNVNNLSRSLSQIVDNTLEKMDVSAEQIAETA